MTTKAEQENVPVWRDGRRGKELQHGMVEVARARLFDYKVVESVQSAQKSLYPNGHAWAAFARLNGPPPLLPRLRLLPTLWLLRGLE